MAEIDYIPSHHPASEYTCMISDAPRNTFYRNALTKTVKDKIVLDVGTGTGILTAYALEAGAKFVYAIERNPLSAKMANTVLSQCYDSSRFKIIEGNARSKEVIDQIPKGSIDVFVAELLGRAMFDQGQYESWKNFETVCHKHTVYIPDSLVVEVYHWEQLNDNQIIPAEVTYNPIIKNINLPKFENALHNYLLQNISTETNEVKLSYSTKNASEWIDTRCTLGQLKHVNRPEKITRVINVTPKTTDSTLNFQYNIDKNNSVIALNNRISCNVTGDQLEFKNCERLFPWMDSFFYKNLKPGTYEFTFISEESKTWTIKKLNLS